MTTSYCNYGTLGGPCRAVVEDAVGLCAQHDQPRYTVCGNCGAGAVRECTIETAPGARCGQALCINCVHGQNGHQRIDEVPDAFQGSPRHPRVQQERQDVHDQLTAVVVRTLVRLQEQGALTLQTDADPERVAEQFIRDLGVHALAGLLMGMAVTRT